MKKISACIFIVLAIGIYGIFDLYLSTTSEEFISNWIEAEATSIQQGDVISSISKGYRIFKKSQFVQGLGLFDRSTGQNLIPVGEEVKVNQNDLQKATNETKVKRTGFLIYTAYKEVDSEKGLVLVAKIYSLFFHLFYIFTVLIGMLLLLAFYSFVKIQKRLEYQNILKAMKNLIGQLEHDSASPLQVISNLVSESKNIHPDKKSLIDRSVVKIQKMFEDANSYRLNLENNKPSFKKNVTGTDQELKVHTNVALAIRNIVKEKWEEYQGTGVGISKDIQLDALTTYSPIDTVVLNRILSNIINNAAEAKSGEKVKIEINLKQQGERAIIIIKDNGKGIQEKVLPKLGERGATFGKENGKGLGLHYAKSELEEVGGELKVESKEGEGTAVSLVLPLSYKPKISLSELFITDNEMVVVDDDVAIHKRWCDILPHCFNKEKINHVHNIRRFRQLDHNGSKSYIMDYELGGLEEIKGLDLINNYRLEDTSVLSTFSANNPLLQKKCIETGVAILPKELLGEFNDSMADV